MSVELTAEEQRALRAAATWFLPPSAAYPSFDHADPDNSVLGRVLHQLAPLHDEIRAALHALPANGVADHLHDLQATDADQFATLRTVCLGWYFTCRPVWNALGYTGRRPAPIGVGEAEHHLRDGLLDPVIKRGKIFRPA